MVSLSFSIYLIKYISIFGICVRFPGGNLKFTQTLQHLIFHLNWLNISGELGKCVDVVQLDLAGMTIHHACTSSYGIKNYPNYFCSALSIPSASRSILYHSQMCTHDYPWLICPSQH